MIENPIIQQDIDFFIEHFPFTEHIKEKTILVTGATGLIGSVLIKCLLHLIKTEPIRSNVCYI